MQRTDDEWIALAALAGAELGFGYQATLDVWIARSPATPRQKSFSIYGVSKAGCAREWLAMHDKLPSR